MCECKKNNKILKKRKKSKNNKNMCYNLSQMPKVKNNGKREHTTLKSYVSMTAEYYGNIW